jgi:putative solute:sodium symporter small subunit
LQQNPTRVRQSAADKQKTETCDHYTGAGIGTRGGRALDFQVSKGETSRMIERKERKPYWRHTKWQMVASLAPFFAVIIILPLYADRLNSNKFLGFPLGYFLAAHGLVLIAVITVASFVRQQDAIDHWHGAHEDN